MLADLKRDGLYGLAWAALGVAGGACPNAIDAVYRAFAVAKPEPLSALGLANISFFLIGAAVAMVCFIVAATRGGRSREMFDEIIEQPISGM